MGMYQRHFYYKPASPRSLAVRTKANDRMLYGLAIAEDLWNPLFLYEMMLPKRPLFCLDNNEKRATSVCVGRYRVLIR
jgi:hypothetical protein